jgi:hypothetical protein
MICLRCGHCCIDLDVAIVNPRSIRSDGTVDPEDSEPVIFKPKGQLCPHLIYLEDKAACKIHQLLCYRGTPCEQFEQIGRVDDICMMKSYFQLAWANAHSQEQSKDLENDAKEGN